MEKMQLHPKRLFFNLVTQAGLATTILAQNPMLMPLSAAPRAEPRIICDPTFPLIQTPANFKPRRQTTFRKLHNGQELTLFEAEGPGCVRHLWLTTAVSGRGLRIRIVADDAPEPQVDMELNPFFGILLGKDPYLVESPGVKVLPFNAYNCYLPMPFSKSCRISVAADGLDGITDAKAQRWQEGKPEKASVYAQVDWQQYGAAGDLTPYRLHALFREENPAQAGGSYRVADFEGRGFVAGLFKAIRRLDKRDLLYHTGGSTWLIDGETEPNAYRGFNEEDDFSFSYGFFKQHQSQWVGSPLQSPEGIYADEYVAWRFFGPDPVPFKSSFQLDCGSRADQVQSVLYFYKVPGSKAPPIITPAQWEIRAPFAGLDFKDFTREETAEEISKAPLHTTVAASHGWVDVRPVLCAKAGLWQNEAKAYVARDPDRIGSSDRWPVGFSIYAQSSLPSQARKTVDLRLAFDDWLTLWINGRKITTLRHEKGFEIARIPVTLEKGENTIQIKLNNTDNREFRLWAMSCVVEDMATGK